MITRKVWGDLIKMAKAGEFEVIAHGCNCFRNMGAGIARQIKYVFPEAYEVDRATAHGSKKKLGTLSCASIGDLDVLNLYTQFSYGGGRINVDYKAIEKCFTTVNQMYKNSDVEIGIPLIGCGLAGGDWKKVEQIINSVTPDIDITLVEYDGN